MKYTVDSWIHAHYTSTVEADSFEEAKKDVSMVSIKQKSILMV